MTFPLRRLFQRLLCTKNGVTNGRTWRRPDAHGERVWGPFELGTLRLYEILDRHPSHCVFTGD
jgi:hypothetical protein